MVVVVCDRFLRNENLYFSRHYMNHFGSPIIKETLLPSGDRRHLGNIQIMPDDTSAIIDNHEHYYMYLIDFISFILRQCGIFA